MHSYLFPLIAALLVGVSATAELQYTTPAEALQQATAQQKGVMMVFTGSDWCGACKMLETQALSRPDVQEAITAAFIPTELDFPRQKQQDAQTKATLARYKQSYGITGFPTLVFADKQGRPVHIVVGYSEPSQLLQDTATATELLKKQQALTAKLADKLSDQQRRETLTALLQTVPQSTIRTFYKQDLDELTQLDPQDVSGIRTQLNQRDLLQSQREELSRSFRQHKLHQLIRQDPQQAISLIDSHLQRQGLLPGIKQGLLSQKARLLLMQNRVHELEAPLREAVALCPDSQEGKQCADLLNKLPEIKRTRGSLAPGERPQLPAGAIPATKMILPPRSTR